MDEERRRILEVLGQQRIIPQEAAELLAALEDGSTGQARSAGADASCCGEDPGGGPPARAHLRGRIRVGGFGRVLHAWGRRQGRRTSYD